MTAWRKDLAGRFLLMLHGHTANVRERVRKIFVPAIIGAVQVLIIYLFREFLEPFSIGFYLAFVCMIVILWNNHS